MENYAIVFGSDLYIGTNGILTIEIDNKVKEFFRIREIFKVLSEGSYLAVDCDIKDQENKRQIKLAKSKPVVIGEGITVEHNKKLTHVKRENGSTIIKIEQISIDELTLPDDGPVRDTLRKEKPDAILRITGDFYAGPYHLIVSNKEIKIGGITLQGNVHKHTGALTLTSTGFGM
jgi:hypothetical protein